MLIGACWPYLDQRPAPPETWEVFRGLEPGCVRVCSNAAPRDLEGLHARWAGLRFVVRAKLPKLAADGRPLATGDERPDLLDYREWPSEPSLRDCIERLLGWGHAVDLELVNEPDLEWDEARSWGPADRWRESALDCRGWLERQWEQIGHELRVSSPEFRVDLQAQDSELKTRASFRLVGPALSEGWPERHALWLECLEPLYRRCQALAVHAYTNGRSFDDRDWGGRPLEYAARWPGKPLLLSEVNDNGVGGGSIERGGVVGGYLGWLTRACPAVELACLFALPGQPNVPAWWGIDAELVAGVRAGLALAWTADGARGAGTGGEHPPTPTPTPEGSNAMPEYRLGIKAKVAELGRALVGEPLEDERYVSPDYALQFSERGVFIYSKQANRVHFLAAR